MVLKVGALARLAGAGPHKRIQRWVAAHHGLVTAVASVALGSLVALVSLTELGLVTARWGTPGRWALLVDGVSFGWLVGAVTFAALMPDRAPDRRRAAIARWLLWSTVPVFCLQRIGVHGLLHLRWDRWEALSISAWLVVLIGLQLVASTPERLHKALQRLRDRDILPESVEAGDGMEGELERIAHRWSLAGAWCVPVHCWSRRGSCRRFRTGATGCSACRAPDWSLTSLRAPPSGHGRVGWRATGVSATSSPSAGFNCGLSRATRTGPVGSGRSAPSTSTSPSWRACPRSS